MPNEDLKKKLVALGTKVQGRQLTQLEESRLEQVLQAKAAKPKSRSEVRQVLAEGLSRTETDVLIKLAANDDNDRLLDDIVNLLGK